MKATRVIPVALIIASVTWLVFSASRSTSMEVVTVAEIKKAEIKKAETADSQNSTSTKLDSIRLGGQVVEGSVTYEITPKPTLSFQVRDRAPKGKEPSSDSIKVRYIGLKPDSFQEGRDVILEGDYIDATFEAVTLLTQCPSKYEPPLPPGSENNGDSK
mgnify:CR=1 FL=1